MDEFNSKILDLEPNLRGFARSLLRNTDDIDDLVQDTYMKALKNQDKFKEGTNLAAWTFTIMRNIFITDYRKKRFLGDKEFRIASLTGFETMHKTDFPSPESELNEKDILKNISHLPQQQRTPFEMHIKGYQYDEISKILNLSMGTVKSRIFFTRKKLMKTLENN